MGDAPKLKTHRRDWEEVAAFNPEWAVLTAPDAKFDGWDMDAFFRSGAASIKEAMDVGAELGLPRRRVKALDFGCGVGRLAPALSETFEQYVGVDISARMIERARELNQGLDNAEFVVNEEARLSRFNGGEFDAIVSFLVLQHMPNRAVIRAYLEEMTRVLAPGGLIAVQMLSHIPPIYRLKVRRRLYQVVRALGVSVDRAHRWGLQAMQLTSISRDDVRNVFLEHGCEVPRDNTVTVSQGVVSTTYYASKP